MKFSPLVALAAGAATLLPGAAAFPFLSNADSNMINQLVKVFTGQQPDQLNGLVAELKKGLDAIGDFQPAPGKGILGLNFANLNEQSVIDAFGLNTDPAALHNNTQKRANFIGLGVGEDEAHPWIAPGPNDKRGPCPGLNTIANHGYIPRNGIVNPIELVVGTFQGLHLSPDGAIFLALISFIWKGDLPTLTLSIGGQSGIGGGLSSHGLLEGDASVTRDDAYFGNQWSVQPRKVQQYVDEINRVGGGQVTAQVVANMRQIAWKESRDTNPNFDFNPWRMLVAYAESGFQHQVLRGNLKNYGPAEIQSWFLQERFPPGWSPRLIPFSIPEALAWAAVFEALNPSLPGWSLGIKGLFIPLPTFGGLSNFFGGIVGNGKTGGNPLGTVGAVGCAFAGAVTGWFPTQFAGLLGNLNIGGIPGALKC
ncbi:Aromatic peroxygenase [Vanrija pseudolonga]|uniref:Aromatic peroxygenase n=1 Tax=Vanrija pseudolonga TaxID=143232 RepID=A0AAF1BR09_9TREE|nr:Aromatic peroxygenase [Vanrija pseudolonga]